LLLQKSAREALNLSLKDHIVVIDEAHNLMDAIIGVYSISVTLTQVQQARMQLTIYLQKFRNKLKGKNRVYVAQTIRMLDCIIDYLQSRMHDSRVGDGLADVGALMAGKGVDQINLLKLNTYIHESKLARKVDAYTIHLEKSTTDGVKAMKPSSQVPRHSVPVLTHIQGFLLALMNPSTEGRFFYSKEGSNDIALKYMLLDPASHFKDIVEEARAVVLAGGTMSPVCVQSVCTSRAFC
jgi:chromosome transmission fidelity protein 1